MTTVDSINYFNSSSNISTDYDFNNDGKVDIVDYNLAKVYLNDDDPTNDVSYSQANLDEVFASLIEAENQNQSYDEITEKNVDEAAKSVISAISQNDPQTASNLKELQTIGKNLTKYIKECAEIEEIYTTQITTYKKELDALAEERTKKETEYKSKEAAVNEKKEALTTSVTNTMKITKRYGEERQRKAEAKISECVDNYVKGEYPNMTLQEVLVANLGSNASGSCNCDTTELQNEIAKSKSISGSINALCGEIDTLVSDMRDVCKDYNTKNAQYTGAIDGRTSIIAAAQSASDKYKTGYQKRIDLRNTLIQTYYTEGTGTDKYTTDNNQVKKLGVFLDNKELDNMTLSDAWAVMSEAFDDCGIKFKDDGSIVVPNGHGTAAKNIYSALVQSLKDNFGIDAIIEDDVYDTTGSSSSTGTTSSTVTTLGTVARTDPISFSDGNMKYDFINDNNSNGIFDDSSEFLGAKNGWQEMKAYDADGDGHISGDELANLKVLATDQTNGQYSFQSAADIGISDINLNSYKSVNQAKVTGDLLDGTFSLTKDGKNITGEQTYDLNRNLDATFATAYGSSLESNANSFEYNPFMEDFTETVNTDTTNANAENEVENSERDVEQYVAQTNSEIRATRNNAERQGEIKKEAKDEAEAEEQRIAEQTEAKKQEKIEEEKAQELKKEQELQAEKEQEEEELAKKQEEK